MSVSYCPYCNSEITSKHWWLVSETDTEGMIACPSCGKKSSVEHECGNDGQCSEWLVKPDPATPQADIMRRLSDR